LTNGGGASSLVVTANLNGGSALAILIHLLDMLKKRVKFNLSISLVLIQSLFPMQSPVADPFDISRE